MMPEPGNRPQSTASPGTEPRRKRRDYGWGTKTLYLSAPFFLAGLAFFLRKPLLALSQWSPPCPFHTLTGWYCPGCGNTRSVRALLNGDLLLSLRYNAAPLLVLLGLLLLYAEGAAALFGRPRKLLPRTAKFWVPFGVLAAIYWVVRNAFPMPL